MILRGQILRGQLVTGGQLLPDGVVEISGNRVVWAGPASQRTDPLPERASCGYNDHPGVGGRSLPRRRRIRFPRGRRVRIHRGCRSPPDERHDLGDRLARLRAAADPARSHRAPGRTGGRGYAGRNSPGRSIPVGTPLWRPGSRQHSRRRPGSARVAARSRPRAHPLDDDRSGDSTLRANLPHCWSVTVPS